MQQNLPVILLKGTILMPEYEIKLEFEDEKSKAIIEEAELFHDGNILAVTKRDLEENIVIKNLPRIGTISKIERKLELPNGKVRLLLKGIERAVVLEYLVPSNDSIESLVSKIEKQEVSKVTKDVVIKKLYSELDNYIKRVPNMSNSILSLISNVDDLDKITDIIAFNISLDNKRLFEYLLEVNSLKRVEMILEDIYKGEQLFNIENNIDTKVKRELDKDEKNFYLKEKISLLQKELGELSPKEKEIENLKSLALNLNTSDTVREKILYEISRYESMSNMSPEFSMVRNYIDFILKLPWGITTNDETDFNLIRERLDNEHFDLDEVKTRIVEYLAVHSQSDEIDTPIICLVGPPGVGKTTLASSIAKSIGKNFVKISVGGLDDEALIKGHLRTYVGALPGKIIDGIRRAKSCNPVFLIDEIDKMCNSYKGDPASALLEILDINQNRIFKDNYVEEEYDLSKVLFIVTANDASKIPDVLKDRLEIINISGYTELEKLQISKKYLIPKICSKHGISEIKISDDNLLSIIRYYTKESGVRDLNRKISKIIRKIVAEKVIDSKKIPLAIKDISKYLGKKIYHNEDLVASEIGMANGLAYTSFGGDIVQIESNFYEGSSDLVLTGSLGETTLESAKVALGYIKSNYAMFNIDYSLFSNSIHINIPNISIKKDGPSAGIAIVTSIISALTNLKVNNNIAFTGEISLRGNILKVGGIKEKILGAYINNIDTVLFPKSNLEDLDSIPSEIKEKISFIPVENYKEVYEYLIKA